MLFENPRSPKEPAPAFDSFEAESTPPERPPPMVKRWCFRREAVCPARLRRQAHVAPVNYSPSAQPTRCPQPGPARESQHSSAELRLVDLTKPYFRGGAK